MGNTVRSPQAQFNAQQGSSRQGDMAGRKSDQGEVGERSEPSRRIVAERQVRLVAHRVTQLLQCMFHNLLPL